jgi:transcriptional regulator with PAS, ATPase and Fis domain
LESIAVDVRIIAASSQPLEQMVETGKFSKELFALLAVVPIHIDPLRDRPEDLIPLISYFIQQEVGDGEEMPSLDRMAKKTLEAYHWPGNVRELENAMHCAMASNCDNVITRDDLPANVNAAAQLTDHSPTDSGRGTSLKAFLGQKEREYVADMVKKMNGDKEKVANALNISLSELNSKLGE